MNRRGTKRIIAGSALALLISAVTVAVGMLPGPARAAEVSLGAGIFSVDGSLVQNLSLPLGGTYYLTVAAENASTFVNASLTYNGSLVALENASASTSTFASLPAGNYTLSLAGHGRAALGWDFTDGAVENFPVNAILVAFLAPLGPKVEVSVVRGAAQTIRLAMYSASLLPVGNTTVTADDPVTFILPPSAASVAYLVAQVTAGASNGIYGLSWSSGPLNPPLDFTAWPLFLLWILVPVAVVFVIFVLLHRRRAGR